MEGRNVPRFESDIPRFDQVYIRGSSELHTLLLSLLCILQGYRHGHGDLHTLLLLRG